MKTDEITTFNPKTVGVHSGTFHSDEVFAVAALSVLYPDMEVIRTRDPDVLNTCDIVIDVGDDYNHTARKYDHHMSWFSTRHKKPFKRRLPNGEFKEYEQGPLRSGFGLIWLHYGTEIVKKALQEYYADVQKVLDTLREYDYLDIQQELDNNLVARVDALDNGEGDEFDLNQEPFRGVDLQRLIGSYNPTILEQEQCDPSHLETLFKKKFDDAVAFAKAVLLNECYARAEMNYYRNVFMQLLGKKDPKDPVLILDQYIPWAYAYGRAGEATTGVEMVVFPSATGTWMCQSPKYYERRDKMRISPFMPDGSRRKNKHLAPEAVRGMRDENLEKVTNVIGAIFVHKSGHLGAAKTKEAAIALAHYFINKGV